MAGTSTVKDSDIDVLWPHVSRNHFIFWDMKHYTITLLFYQMTLVNLTSWWLNHPIWKKCAQVKLDHFLKHPSENKHIWNHQVVKHEPVSPWLEPSTFSVPLRWTHQAAHRKVMLIRASSWVSRYAFGCGWTTQETTELLKRLAGKSTSFNRRYIFIHGCFELLSCCFFWVTIWGPELGTWNVEMIFFCINDTLYTFIVI